MTKPLVLASRKDFSKNLNIIKPGQARYFEKNEKKEMIEEKWVHRIIDQLEL